MPALPQIGVILTSRWLHYAVLLALLAVAFAWGRTGWDNAAAWKLAQQSQAAATIAAQGEAKAKAIAARIETENESYRLAKQSEESNETIDAMQRDADAFAARRSGRLCPQAGTVAGAGIRPATAPASGPAPLDNGPGQLEVVVLLKPEFDDLIGYAKRTEQNRQWGESMILRGLAVTEVDFAKELDPPPRPSE